LSVRHNGVTALAVRTPAGLVFAELSVVDQSSVQAAVSSDCSPRPTHRP
jgi:hypothetical protein